MTAKPGIGAALLLAASVPVSAADLDCLIQPKSTVTVSSHVEGRVESILVERGDPVEKGQVVAQLESSLERATYAIAKERAEVEGRIKSSQVRSRFAKTELERQQSLEERHVVSTREMDEARENLQLAEAQLLEAGESRRIAELERDRTAADLELRSIRSPVSGIVVQRLIEPGEYADPPQILDVAEIDPLYVEVFAPLGLLGKIEVGMRAEVHPEAPVGGVLPAEVTVVDRVVDAASGTFGVRLTLPNPDYAIPAGLRCRAHFPVEAAAGSGARSAASDRSSRSTP